MPQTTAREWAKTWLEMKAIETEASTHERYQGVIDRFVDSLGRKADRDIVTIRPTDIAKLRDEQVKTLSRSSANLTVKVLRGYFSTALKRGLLTTNPALAVDVLKQRGESKRRPFTVAEVKRLLAAADMEWRGLILFGLYTGQRLGDLASLTWRTVKLGTSTQDSEVAFQTQKTGRRMALPLVAPLFDYLTELPTSDSPNAPLFPRSAAAASTATLSNQFRQLLVSVGMAENRPHRSTGKGRNTTRERADISFHCLRHTATTFLKAAGVSNAMAMDIIGHDSEAISRAYTHFSSEDLRRSIDKLPDVTKE
jgi:integrase